MATSIFEHPIRTDSILYQTEPIPDPCFILGFDPATTANLGWAAFQYKDGIASHCDSGVIHLKSDGITEKERLIGIYNAMVGFSKKYAPVHAYVFERSMSAGGRTQWAIAREQLAENTGVMKLAIFHVDSIPISVQTNHMTKLLAGESPKDRAAKKKITIETCRRMFPIKLQGKKIKDGLDHESDAIGFCVAFFFANGIQVQGDVTE